MASGSAGSVSFTSTGWEDAQSPRYKKVDAFLSRTGDLVASGLGLCAMVIPMLLIGLLVRLDSHGPALYRQERVGWKGRTFTILKFRSMRADAESGGHAWAGSDDDRVTRIGRFMRRTRLDELPQLWNILCGDMAMVGPRPERPCFHRDLSADIPGWALRIQVKPGLTGLAQVTAGYAASVDEARTKLAYDLHYIRTRSILLDTAIMLRTVVVVLSGRGAR